jgi:hypothetical protein
VRCDAAWTLGQLKIALLRKLAVTLDQIDRITEAYRADETTFSLAGQPPKQFHGEELVFPKNTVGCNGRFYTSSGIFWQNYQIIKIKGDQWYININ